MIRRWTGVARWALRRGYAFGRRNPPHRFDLSVGIGYGHRLASFCAIRAFTSFRTSAAGRGFSIVKRMVPLDVWYGASAFLCACVSAVLMKRLQGSLNAA